MDFLHELIGGFQPFIQSLIPDNYSDSGLKRVMFVKGSNRLASKRQLDTFFGSSAHIGLQNWMRGRKNLYKLVCWDGDELKPSSFTQLLLFDVPTIMQIDRRQQLCAFKKEDHASDPGFQKTIAILGCTYTPITDAMLEAAADGVQRPSRLTAAQWEFTMLGSVGMRTHGRGDVLVLGGGPVVLEEFKHAAFHLPHAYNWYCFKAHGCSHICDAYEAGALEQWVSHFSVRPIPQQASASNSNDAEGILGYAFEVS